TDWKAQEDDIERKARECVDATGKTKMLSLMQYAHFDTALIKPVVAPPAHDKVMWGDDEPPENEPADEDALDAAIEDDVLRDVLREEGRRIGFVFTKRSI
ncbi:helicase, partial [Friedmanniomyces endolithicus]